MDTSTMALIVQTCGVVGALIAATIAVRSYVNSNKRSQETRDRDLETRQAQLFMQIFIVNQSKEMADAWFKLYSMDLSDVKGIVEKGWIRGEAEMEDLMKLVAMIGTHDDGIGLYAKKGLIDLDMVKELLLGDYLMMWKKLKPLMMEVRKTTPFAVENFE